VGKAADLATAAVLELQLQLRQQLLKCIFVLITTTNFDENVSVSKVHTITMDPKKNLLPTSSIGNSTSLVNRVWKLVHNAFEGVEIVLVRLHVRDTGRLERGHASGGTIPCDILKLRDRA
jgi:exosome complex RNA-binding protein Rrp42 (RNase PH superfamily)